MEGSQMTTREDDLKWLESLSDNTLRDIVRTLLDEFGFDDERIKRIVESFEEES
jgi:hypothetical protein